jgi:hypothetical protein
MAPEGTVQLATNRVALIELPEQAQYPTATAEQ